MKIAYRTRQAIQGFERIRPLALATQLRRVHRVVWGWVSVVPLTELAALRALAVGSVHPSEMAAALAAAI